MSEKSDKKEKKTLSLGKKLGDKSLSSVSQVRQSFSHGRSKTVEVEVKRKRRKSLRAEESVKETPETSIPEGFTKDEWEARLKVAKDAFKVQQTEQANLEAEREKRRLLEEKTKAEFEENKKRQQDIHAKQNPASESSQVQETPSETKPASPKTAAPFQEAQPQPSGPKMGAPETGFQKAKRKTAKDKQEEDAAAKQKAKAASSRASGGDRRRTGKITIQSALSGGEGRTRSLASIRRAREKERQNELRKQDSSRKHLRDVIIPETISVQELANRMAERGADVVKTLMKLGIMATINQSIDADTAELVVSEFGHKFKRISESDVESDIKITDENPTHLIPRPPVVTIMGHVDHGKTSLLDALRSTDVVAGEAGGITQHIGAYQVTLESNDKITFVDTPGHAAFTEMRARGADVTDIVILLVAADDGVKEQTIEAINHAKAAKVPLIVAINKVDKPEANPDKVKQDLLRHDLFTEDMGGDILCIEVSAKNRLNLHKLEEAILLQAEILELKASPEGQAQGAVVEAKLDKGRGPVATVLIQRGTLKVGDIFVTGAEWGRVRALLNDQGKQIQEAGPSTPVEIVGLNGVPKAGDDFVVVPHESKAREVADYRKRKVREKMAVQQSQTSMEQMFSQAVEQEGKKTLFVVIKGDVQGSIEAISHSLQKLSTENEEVEVHVLHTGVGGINESDVTLARASNAVIVGFNVRANAQAREVSQRDQVPIKYYSIIYNVIDDIKASLSGMLSPVEKEIFTGNAEIRQVILVSKVGKIAGCMITEGVVKRGAKVRLLRDNIAIHEGHLKTLKRFKDEVKEVREGYECGMAFENYNDIKVGDVIECFEIEHVKQEF